MPFYPPTSPDVARSHFRWPAAGPVLPLDAFSGPAPYSAFAFRKLRAAYAGMCYQIRRASDSTLQDIPFSGALVAAAAAESFCGIGNGYQAAWYDQMGNQSAGQSATTSQPQTVSGGVHLQLAGGSYCAQYDGGNDALIASASPYNWAIYTAAEHTVFAVCGPVDGALFYSENATYGVLHHKTPRHSLNANRDYQATNYSLGMWAVKLGDVQPSGTRKTFTWTAKDAEPLENYVDGVSNGTGDTPTLPPFTTLRFESISNFPGFMFSGKLESLLLFTARLTAAQILELHTLLA